MRIHLPNDKIKTDTGFNGPPTTRGLIGYFDNPSASRTRHDYLLLGENDNTKGKWFQQYSSIDGSYAGRMYLRKITNKPSDTPPYFEKNIEIDALEYVPPAKSSPIINKINKTSDSYAYNSVLLLRDAYGLYKFYELVFGIYGHPYPYSAPRLNIYNDLGVYESMVPLPYPKYNYVTDAGKFYTEALSQISYSPITQEMYLFVIYNPTYWTENKYRVVSYNPATMTCSVHVVSGIAEPIPFYHAVAQGPKDSTPTISCTDASTPKITSIVTPKGILTIPVPSSSYYISGRICYDWKGNLWVLIGDSFDWNGGDWICNNRGLRFVQRDTLENMSGTILLESVSTAVPLGVAGYWVSNWFGDMTYDPKSNDIWISWVESHDLEDNYRSVLAKVNSRTMLPHEVISYTWHTSDGYLDYSFHALSTYQYNARNFGLARGMAK